MEQYYVVLEYRDQNSQYFHNPLTWHGPILQRSEISTKRMRTRLKRHQLKKRPHLSLDIRTPERLGKTSLDHSDYETHNPWKEWTRWDRGFEETFFY